MWERTTRKMNFDKDYYIGGAESNYKLYPYKKYTKLAKEIKNILKLKKDKSVVLDYGCGTGNLLNYLSKYIYYGCGTDISNWAINYAFGNNEKNNISYVFYDKKTLLLPLECVLFLDVLEHCYDRELKEIFKVLNRNTHHPELLVRIPVSARQGEDFVLDVSKKDKTHIQINCKKYWERFFNKNNYRIKKVIKGDTIYDSEGVLVWLLERFD